VELLLVDVGVNDEFGGARHDSLINTTRISSTLV
jgi:hypothetical protein